MRDQKNVCPGNETNMEHDARRAVVDFGPQFAVGDYVIIKGEDFTFEGIVRAAFPKASGRYSYAVEDNRGVVHTYSHRLMHCLDLPEEK